MPNFYGIEYNNKSYTIGYIMNSRSTAEYKYFEDEVITDKDFHNTIYTAMAIFENHKNMYCTLLSK